MIKNDPLLTESYDYILPEELIATYPASPRDHARLLVFNRETDTIIHTRFDKINDFLPQNAAIIFNNTKVIKARIYGRKSTGGKVELLINRPLDAYKINVYIRGKVKETSLLTFDHSISAQVLELHNDGSRTVSFYQNNRLLSFESLIPLLDSIGHIPLPPYLGREDNSDDEKEYQSVFALNQGAVAAPTASLHFTEELFKKVCSTHNYAFVTLHVGAGTFKPVEAKIITDHPMHSEYFYINDNAAKIINSNQPIVCIGTTSTRTIEFYARTNLFEGEANLFLHPNNLPIRVNHLLTNFHLPQSTLLMLVASFIGLEKTQEIYQEAIKQKYRFFSYGDALLIL